MLNYFFMEKTNKFNHIIEIVSIIGVAITLTLTSNLVLKHDTVENIPTPIPAPYKEKDLINKVLVVKDFNNSSSNGKPDSSFSKHISVIGSIDHGYLYIKANVNNKSLSIYDKIYLKLQNNHTAQQIGGWLVQDKSLNTPKSEQSTEFLFDLSNVFYEQIDNNGIETISGDWLKMLNQNQSDSKSVIGFSSTLRNGEIEEIDISYNCSTGSNCSISTSN